MYFPNSVSTSASCGLITFRPSIGNQPMQTQTKPTTNSAMPPGVSIFIPPTIMAAIAAQ